MFAQLLLNDNVQKLQNSQRHGLSPHQLHSVVFPPLWIEAFKGDTSKFEQIFDVYGFRSTVDLPAAAMFEELMERWGAIALECPNRTFRLRLRCV